MARAPLEERLADPGFSPGRRDYPALFALLLGDDDALAKKAEAVWAKTGEAGTEAILALAEGKMPPAKRHRVVRVLGVLGGLRAREHLLARLAEGTGKERRWAATSLAKVWPDGCETVLLDALASATHPEDVRAFVQALGKVGGSRTREVLAALGANDPETERVLGKARLLLARTATRGEERVVVDLDAPLPRVTLRFTCREGLETVLAEELSTIGKTAVTATGPGIVAVSHEGPLRPLTAVRIALDLAFEIDAPRRPEVPLATRVADLLVSEPVLAIVRALTPKTDASEKARFRLELPEGAGRAAVFAVARKVAESGAPLVNDPTASTWSVTTTAREARISVLLSPRGVLDERFAYRKRDVPAASHPTIAAALARLSEPKANDVVWDPFCGAGTELVERAKAGPYEELFGSDLRGEALDAAGANLKSAHVSAMLAEADANTVPIPGGLTLVLTNPPLGRRVRGEHETLLANVLKRVGKALRPGGRLVWVSPTRRLDAVAEAAGLALVRAFDVDLGGFTARIEVRRKSDGPTTTKPGSP